MAEFISAIVGLIAVGGHVGNRVYQAVEAFKEAPDEFLALSNEITDFRLILNTVERALREGCVPQIVLDEVDFNDILKRSKETFDEIMALLTKVQRLEVSDLEVKRRKWMTNARKAKGLQKKVKGHKMLLSTMLQTYTS